MFALGSLQRLRPEFAAAQARPGGPGAVRQLLAARPFGGTSAASPQAAALAALVWSRHPDWTAEHVRGSLVRAAVHTGPGRHDSETGYGRVHLPVDPVHPR